MSKSRSPFARGFGWFFVAIFAIQGFANVFAESEFQVTIEETETGVIIQADGRPFAEYRTQSGHQPVIWPVVGPTGKSVTRSFPIGPLQSGEKDDHPHHRSLWFSHGDVNGVDMWNVRSTESDDKRRAIRHRTFERLETVGSSAIIVTTNDWLTADGKLCEDLRTVVFNANETHRWIDFSIRLTASEGDLKLGDTKEGTFGVRVAGTMKVDAGLGGQILNSRGDIDGATWGQPAEWVLYQGPVDEETLGIAVMQHPSSFRYPNRWHVRTYGLFAANPFGEKDFPEPRAGQGELTIPHGESIELHYRVLLTSGLVDGEKMADAFAKYAAEEPVETAPRD